MTTCSITIEAVANNRTTKGFFSVEDHWSCDEGFSITPGSNRFDRIVCTLDGLDYGRYDSEGGAYLCELLNCLPGDIIFHCLED